MSYESEMLSKMRMPPKIEVEKAILEVLFKHSGVIKEFSAEQDIVHEMAGMFNLDDDQRNAYLETVYRKENRLKKSNLWHRLLFRAADSLAKEKLVSRPTSTFKLTNKKEWMLTELGYDKALFILNIPTSQKNILPTKSFEVEKIIKKLNDKIRPENYNPFDENKKISQITKEQTLRERGFRQAVIAAYDYQCAFCGMKLKSPDNLCWEVEAAHIVPHSFKGKDDIWNGIALCHLHHWAFDVGWFTIKNNFEIVLSSKADYLPSAYAKLDGNDCLKRYDVKSKILLPKSKHSYPHPNALSWHQKNKFHR